MPELTFVFGPNNTFFFDSPKSWKFHSIPPTLRQLFNASMSPEWRIAQPICLALGPQINSTEPVWYVSCRVCSGEEKMFYSQGTFDQNYPSLSAWTKTIPNAPRACYVTFGPNLSYFASARGHGSMWAGIPSDLTDKIQKAYDTPNCVALGVNNAWFVMWPDGYFSWKFYGNYQGLDEILKEAEPRSVSYLAISPYNPEHFFVAFHDRTVKYNFKGAPEWMPQMQEVFLEWQAEIQQSQYQRYQQPTAASPPPQWGYPHAQSPGSLSPASFGPPQQQMIYPYMQSPGPIELPAEYTPMSGPLSRPLSQVSGPASTPTSPPMHPSTPMYQNPQPNMGLSPYNATAATQLPVGRPVSIMSKSKKRSFFSKKLDKLSSKDSATAAGATAVKATAMVASEGTQTCNVM